MQTNNGLDLTSTTSESTPPIQATNPPPQQWQQPQQQQQWMVAPAAMQYHTAAMMMQQQQMMMYPHQYVPRNQGLYNRHHHPQHHQYGSYQQQHQQHNKPLHRGSGYDVKTLWVGNLLDWMDETYLHSCFSHIGKISSVNVIRNKLTSQSEGYGFVEFLSRAVAKEVLQKYNGSIMPNSDKPFLLNWTSDGKRAVENGQALPSSELFVGDLSPDVTEDLLHEIFSSRYPSVNSAKIVIDPNTGRSKGHGYVRFGDENETSRALTEMNGALCFNTKMRVDILRGSQSSTVFVGGIDSDVTLEDLRQPFSQIGEVVSVNIPVGKGCGFVQFADRKSAEDAIKNLNGTIIGKNTVRLSWGRSSYAGSNS